MTAITLEPPLSAKVISFVREAFVAFRDKVTALVRSFYQHTEAIVVMLLASLGLNALLGELPFYMLLPLWIEAPMVIPVLSVIGIGLLVRSAAWRSRRRQVNAR